MAILILIPNSQQVGEAIPIPIPNPSRPNFVGILSPSRYLAHSCSHPAARGSNFCTYIMTNKLLSEVSKKSAAYMVNDNQVRSSFIMTMPESVIDHIWCYLSYHQEKLLDVAGIELSLLAQQADTYFFHCTWLLMKSIYFYCCNSIQVTF